MPDDSTIHSPILSYPTVPTTRFATLVQENGTTLLSFGLLPRWQQWAGIISVLWAASAQTGFFVLTFVQAWQFCNTSPIPLSLPWPMLLTDAVWAFITWVVAICLIVHFHRCSHIQPTLEASPNGLTFSRAGWWNLRRTHWPISMIDNLLTISTRDVFGRKPSTMLVLTLHGRRRRRRFRLHTRDQTLYARACDALRASLQFPPLNTASASPFASSPLPG